MAGLKPKEEDIIVQTSKDGICRKSIRSWFCGHPRRRFVVPLFQRRYLWGKAQCQKFLQVPHDLGTVMVYVNDEDELVIVDGQQRATTLMLIFAALRKRGADVKKILFHNGSPLLQPTFHDKEPFFSVIQNKKPVGDSNVINAMCWFDTWISALTHDAIEDLTAKLLDHCTVLEFTIPRADDSENLQVVYERLAIRSVGIATMCFVANPGINNGVLDLTRNLFLSYYTQNEAINIYHSHWMPLELMVAKDEPVYSLAAEERFIAHIKSFLLDKNWEAPTKETKHPEAQPFTQRMVYLRKLPNLEVYQSLKRYVEQQLCLNNPVAVTSIIQDLLDHREKTQIQ